MAEITKPELKEVMEHLGKINFYPGKKVTVKITQQDFSRGENTTWEKVIDER